MPMETPAARLVAGDRVLVIAHRGDSKAAPENTLAAFRSAVAEGVDLVELDYLHSSDGVPVVFHDKELDRTTDAVKHFGGRKTPLASKSFAELRKLDAGSWFDARFAGERIPTLDESLGAIQAGSVTLIERKTGDAATLVKLLKDKKLLDRVVVQAFDWDFLAECRRLAPELTLVALGEKSIVPERLAAAAKFAPAGVGWRDKDLTPQAIAAIHERGLKVWVWTVDDPQRAKELVAAGIDGVITNVPGKLKQAGIGGPRASKSEK